MTGVTQIVQTLSRMVVFPYAQNDGGMEQTPVFRAVSAHDQVVRTQGSLVKVLTNQR